MNGASTRQFFRSSRFACALLMALGMTSAPAKVLAADPTVADCLVASETAVQAAQQRQLRTERSKLLICAATSCPEDIRKECLRRVDEVNLAIPTLIFDVKDAAGNDLSAVRVSMDGALLADRLHGMAFSVDPGEHTFVFEVPGQAPVVRRFVLLEAQKDRRETVVIGEANERARSSAPVAEPAAMFGTQRTLAVVAAGAALVSVGTGSVFGFRALSQKRTAEEQCPDECRDQAGVKAWDRARASGNWSTAFMVAGGVTAAVGVTLWLTAPSTHHARLTITPTSIAVRGVF